MKKSLIIILVVLASYVANAQVTWLKTSNNYVEAYETASAVNFVELYKSGSTWRVNILDESLNKVKTSDIQTTTEGWEITDNFKFLSISNVLYNVFKVNKMAFEITFYIAENADNKKYATYLFDEDGNMLNLNYGYNGKVTGKYFIHETLDSTWTVSSLPGIANKVSTSKAASIKAFPNPSTQTINLTQSGTVINVYSITGQLIENIQAGSRSIDISSYAPGQYILKVDQETLQFIKN